MGFGGLTASIPTFLIRTELRQLPPLVLEVLASPGEPYVLLGRHVLNRFHIVLDGPKLVIELE